MLVFLFISFFNKYPMKFINCFCRISHIPIKGHKNVWTCYLYDVNDYYNYYQLLYYNNNYYYHYYITFILTVKVKKVNHNNFWLSL